MARRKGSIRRRGPGKYLIRVHVGKVNGRRKYKSRTVDAANKREAQKALTALEYEIDSGDYSEAPSGLTVRTWATEWLKGKRNLRETTRLDYEGMLRNDVLPHVGRMKLEDVQPHHCRTLMADMSTRGLSKRIQQDTHMIFRQCMAQAHADGLIPMNPVDNVDRPTVRKQDTVQKITALTKEQVYRVLEDLQGLQVPRPSGFFCSRPD